MYRKQKQYNSKFTYRKGFTISVAGRVFWILKKKYLRKSINQSISQKEKLLNKFSTPFLIFTLV